MFVPHCINAITNHNSNPNPIPNRNSDPNPNPKSNLVWCKHYTPYNLHLGHAHFCFEVQKPLQLVMLIEVRIFELRFINSNSNSV